MLDDVGTAGPSDQLRELLLQPTTQRGDVGDAGGDRDMAQLDPVALRELLGDVVVEIDEVRRAAGDGDLVAQPELGDLRLGVRAADAHVRVVRGGVRDEGAQPALGSWGERHVDVGRRRLRTQADAHDRQPEGLDPVGQVAQVGVRAELVGQRQQEDVGRGPHLGDGSAPLGEHDALGVAGEPVPEG